MLLHCLEISIPMMAIATVVKAEYHVYKPGVNGMGKMAPSKQLEAA